MKLRMIKQTGTRSNGFYHVFVLNNPPILDEKIHLQKSDGPAPHLALNHIYSYLRIEHPDLLIEQIGIIKSSIYIDHNIDPDHPDIVMFYKENVYMRLKDEPSLTILYGFTVQRETIITSIEWHHDVSPQLKEQALHQSRKRVSYAYSIFDTIHAHLYNILSSTHDECQSILLELNAGDDPKTLQLKQQKIAALITRYNTLATYRYLCEKQISYPILLSESVQQNRSNRSLTHHKKKKKNNKKKPASHIPNIPRNHLNEESLTTLHQKTQKIFSKHFAHATALTKIRLHEDMVMEKLHTVKLKNNSKSKSGVEFSFVNRADNDSGYVLKKIIDFGTKQIIELHHNVEQLLHESFRLSAIIPPSEKLSKQHQMLLLLHRYIGTMFDYSFLNALSQNSRKECLAIMPYLTNLGFKLICTYLIYQYKHQNTPLILDCIDMLCREYDLFPHALINNINKGANILFHQLILNYRHDVMYGTEQDKDATLAIFSKMHQLFSKCIDGVTDEDNSLTPFSIWLLFKSAPIVEADKQNPLLEKLIDSGMPIDQLVSKSSLQISIKNKQPISCFGTQALSFFCITHADSGHLFSELVNASTLPALLLSLTTIWFYGSSPYISIIAEPEYSSSKKNIKIIPKSKIIADVESCTQGSNKSTLSVALCIDDSEIPRAQHILDAIYKKLHYGYIHNHNITKEIMEYLLQGTQPYAILRIKTIRTTYLLSLFLQKHIIQDYNDELNNANILKAMLLDYSINQKIGCHYTSAKNFKFITEQHIPSSSRIITPEKMKCFSHYSLRMKKMIQYKGALFSESIKLTIFLNDSHHFIGILLSNTRQPCWESIFRIATAIPDAIQLSLILQLKALKAPPITPQHPDCDAVLERAQRPLSLHKLALKKLWSVLLQYRGETNFRWDSKISELLHKIYKKVPNNTWLATLKNSDSPNEDIQYKKDNMMPATVRCLFERTLQQMIIHQREESGEKTLESIVQTIKGNNKPKQQSYGTYTWRFGSANED